MGFVTNLLNIICYVPLVGAFVIIFLLRRGQSAAIKTVATVTAGLDFVLSLPLWFLYVPDGPAFQFAYVHEWIPSEADRAFVRSLMQRVVEPGKMAGWVAPPERGINNLPVEYEYVKLN